MADNSTRIAEIEAILASGVTSASVNGESVTYNLDSLRQELRRLRATDDTQKGRRPFVSRINLGGFP